MIFSSSCADGRNMFLNGTGKYFNDTVQISNGGGFIKADANGTCSLFSTGS